MDEALLLERRASELDGDAALVLVLRRHAQPHHGHLDLLRHHTERGSHEAAELGVDLLVGIVGAAAYEERRVARQPVVVVLAVVVVLSRSSTNDELR